MLKIDPEKIKRETKRIIDQGSTMLHAAADKVNAEKERIESRKRSRDELLDSIAREKDHLITVEQNAISSNPYTLNDIHKIFKELYEIRDQVNNWTCLNTDVNVEETTQQIAAIALQIESLAASKSAEPGEEEKTSSSLSNQKK